MSRSNMVVLLIIGGFLLYGYLAGADRDDTGQIVSEGTLGAFSLKVGDCTQDLGANDSGDPEIVSSVTAVPCSEPHDNEFYASYNLDHQEFPGEEAIYAIAEEQCAAKFEPFFGIGYEDSVLELYYMYPTVESWAENDREILCAVYHMNGEKLIGYSKGI